MESYPDNVPKDLGGRTSTKAPWQQRNTKKPCHKKRTHPTKTVEGLDEDEEDDDDAYVLDDYDEDEEWYGDEGDDDQEVEDDDQVAFVDEDGWFYVDEETINSVDEMLTWEDDEFANILTTYTEARGALAKARIARGFYPVVVPADSGPQARFGRTGGKGNGKSRGKGSNQPRPKAKSEAKTNSSKLPQWGAT